MSHKYSPDADVIMRALAIPLQHQFMHANRIESILPAGTIHWGGSIITFLADVSGYWHLEADARSAHRRRVGPRSILFRFGRPVLFAQYAEAFYRKVTLNVT